MFKKFKDKLAEEMKQSPARLQASMQQLAQAVVSPSLSNNSIQDLSFKDNFSLTEETDETPKNSPAKHGFQTVDLTSPLVNSNTSRRSSVSSNVSDASFLFPIYEDHGNMYHLQSDMDQSASEIDDNISPQLDHVSKEQLYSAYRKARIKYDKYRGRFTDLVTHYHEIEHAKTKLESLLVETQDKALRRISDLKEQCQLEQQAKAHLEDALRNDIEEKDHVINSLKIKIKLLQEKGPIDDNLENVELSENRENDKVDILVDLSKNSDSEKSSEKHELYRENTQLKEKIHKMEIFLDKYKDMLKCSKHKILEVTNEKNTLERDYDIMQKANQEKLNNLEKLLHNSKEEFLNLKEEIDVLKKREEESVISLAENKLSIHRELEGKEELIKQLQSELKQTIDLENLFKETIEKQKLELEKVHLVANQNAEATQEHLRGKSEALKQMQSEMQQKLIDLEEKMGLKYHEEVNKNKQLLIKLQEFEQRTKTARSESEAIQKLAEELQEKSNLLIAVNNEKEEYKILLDNHKTENINLKKELSKLINTLEKFQFDTDTCDDVLKDDYEKKFNELKQDLEDRNEIRNKSRIQKYVEEFEQLKYKLQIQEEEIVILKSKISDDVEKMLKFQTELENKNTDILGLTSELKSCSITIIDLKKEINNLVDHRNNLITYLKTCKKALKSLKQDHESLKNNVNNNIFNGKRAIFETIQETSKIFSFFNEEETNLKFQINELSEKNKKMEELKDYSNDNTTKLEQTLNEKITLEKELKDKSSEIEEMKLKIKNFNELQKKNATFALEIENLQSKLIELDKWNNEREQLLCKVKQEKEAFLINISLEKQQHETLTHELNLKLADNTRLNKELANLSAKYKEIKEIMQTLKSENEDHNNLIKEIQIIRLQLSFIKQELEDKNNQLKSLQTKSNEEEQQLIKLNIECANYKKIFEENNLKLSYLSKELNDSKEIRKKLSFELEESKDSLQKTLDTKNILEAELKQEKLKLKTAENEWNQSINIKINENEELKTCNSQLAIDLSNLKINENILHGVRKEKTDIIRELDELKSLQILLNNENKSLKDNKNDLLTLNEILKHSQSEALEKLRNLEQKDIEMTSKNIVLLKEIESCKYQLQNINSEMEQLKTQLKELEEIKSKNIELTALLHEAQNYQQKNINVIDKVQNLTRTNELLTAEVESLQNEILDLKQCHENLNHELKSSKSEKIELENSLSLKNQELTAFCSNIQNENNNLNCELTEKKARIEESELKNARLLDEIGELSLLKLNIEEKTSQEINRCREEVNKFKNNLSNKESELKILHEKYAQLEESVENINKENLKNQELNENIQKVMLEKRKLESQLDETLVTFQVKETQMQALHEELKNQAIKLQEELKVSDEAQNLRLKQIVKEFQAQLHDKEKELQAALEKRFNRQKSYESDAIQEYKEQLRDFQIELTKKSDEIERLILDNEQTKKQIQEEIKAHLANISQIKLEHVEEMQDLEKKWKNIVKQKINQLETKHKQEIAELTNEWQNERKNDENTELLDKELENTTRVAMATVKSNTGSFHTLQQTLLSQKRELAELRKLVKIRQESVEDSTEIEYLRNILYKYMMGKETMVLAKVIAAVVKFDQDQTSKILKKEEDKLSLLGSLGLT